MLRDFKCDKCGTVQKDKLTSDSREWPCPYCERGRMVQLPCAPAFSVKGYSAKNGYSKERS